MSLRVVENDADGVALTGTQATHAVAEVDAVSPLGAFDGPVVNREHDRISLLQRNHLNSALHPRPLFGEYKLASGEVPTRLGRQDRRLQWKNQLTVKVLMQAVKVAGNVLQQQRRRPRLAAIVAKFQILGMAHGIHTINSHPLIPAVGDRSQVRKNRGAQSAD